MDSLGNLGAFNLENPDLDSYFCLKTANLSLIQKGPICVKLKKKQEKSRLRKS